MGIVDDRADWVHYSCEDCGKDFGGGPAGMGMTHLCPTRVLRQRVDLLELQLDEIRHMLAIRVKGPESPT